jgi:hypothetical protein
MLELPDFRIRVAMPSEAVDRLVAIVTGLLDFSWDQQKEGDWSAAWLQAQRAAGPSRHSQLLTRMARDISEVEREMEWFPPPSRTPLSIRTRRILKLIRFWLLEGIPGECFHTFLLLGLVDQDERWPEEVRRACESWGSERIAAANYIERLLASNRPRTHAIHGEWPLPEADMADDLVYVAHAVTFAVFLGTTACTARYKARTAEGGRPSKWVLHPVMDALRTGRSVEELLRELSALKVMVSPLAG